MPPARRQFRMRKITILVSVLLAIGFFGAMNPRFLGVEPALAILQACPDLAGFGCVDAAGGQGAAVAVKQAGKVGTVRIVAMDRDEATLQFIEEGIIDASIGQRSYMMSYLALQMLYDLRNERIKFVNGWQQIGVNPLPTRGGSRFAAASMPPSRPPTRWQRGSSWCTRS